MRAGRVKEARDRKGRTNDVDDTLTFTSTLTKKSLAQVRNEVANLWDDLQTPLEERIAFLATVEEAQPYSNDIYNMYTDQHERLQLKIPAINAISRRERLKYQLDALQEILSVPAGQRDPVAAQELQERGCRFCPLECVARLSSSP